MPYVCWVQYPDNSGINEDSIMIWQSKKEALIWEKIIKTTYRDDIPKFKIVPIEKGIFAP